MGTEPATPRPLADIIDCPLPTPRYPRHRCYARGWSGSLRCAGRTEPRARDGVRAEPGRARPPHPTGRALSLLPLISRRQRDGDLPLHALSQLDDLHDEIRADYIKIDVQGAELLVLRSGRRCSGDLQVFLRDQGFLLHKLVDVGGRPMRPVRPANLCAPISQVIWADAIFVRELLPARRLRGRRPGQGRHHPSYRPPILRPRRPSFART
jgi:hypothetical protein